MNLCRLFNAKAILLEEQLWLYLTYSWEDKGCHTFPNGICPKVNVIARLEFEIANYDSRIHRFIYYTTKTSPVDWSITTQLSIHPWYQFLFFSVFSFIFGELSNPFLLVWGLEPPIQLQPTLIYISH